MPCDPDALWSMASTFHKIVTDNQNTDAVYCRAAISRGYYACYHEARGYLHASGGDRISAFIPNPHETVWRLFSGRGKSHIKTGGDGGRGHRNAADYDLYRPYTAADMAVAWIVLEKLRDDLKRLRANLVNPIPVIYP